MVRKNALFWGMTIVCAVMVALGLALPGPAQAGPAASPPHCVTGTFTENSGNGPTFHHVSFCDMTSNTNYMIVDGSALQNKAVIFGSHAGQTVSQFAALGHTAAGLSALKQCFGHNGVTTPGLIMGDCIFQPSGLGGALYWSFNESSFNWDKHPGSNLDWVEASTVHMAPDANPVNNKHDFWTGIARTGGNFCSVINPGYNEEPTMCAFPGQPAHVMSARQAASYEQFEQAMEAANIPDCAWSMTIESSQCDVDS